MLDCEKKRAKTCFHLEVFFWEKLCSFFFPKFEGNDFFCETKSEKDFGQLKLCPKNSHIRLLVNWLDISFPSA